jgi:phage FluMu gp28-like protein
MEKSRQVGISYADAYDSVRKVCRADARLDVWISSRDEAQARLYVEDCKRWARLLQTAARDLGQVVVDSSASLSAHVLELASGRRIYSLSSNPNALAGKRGHVKLDEFALHPDQRLLYRVAKPVTTWGGTLSIISTHRGAGTVFNQIIRDVVERGNPMGWSLHRVPLQRAVDQGLAERINQKSGQERTREEFLKRIRAECIDEEQWLQEYCCQPADESSAFISYELINACADPELRLATLEDMESAALGGRRELFLGVDVARKKDLCVLDLGERIGDVVWDRLRLEFLDTPFSRVESQLYRLLQLQEVKRACVDATGMGLQLAERAAERFGWKVEPVTFSASLKEELACALRSDFEERSLRIAWDDKLHADLRAMKRQVTSAGNLRFAGESEDSHCDRFWAKALRQHAARVPVATRGVVG